MRGTSATLRIAARLVILALASIFLVVLGCTGAQAATAAPATSIAGPGTLTVTSSVIPSGHERPACGPGRDKARVEHNATSPGQSLLQPDPGASSAVLLRTAPLEPGLAQRSGRIPTALTHLDLGIVRT